ncbi:acyl-CoA dehydrogenase family protein [Deinococcus peraridilitoris]|uniref:glutaryl-CoA dehydrogenase (ETF) n=1 Tax=Deinococcus peraridilitoris (strain DSM 19664 / LMG 22246 / CIP 109416 / KR-200) TaxID=937777 RepID=L0A4A9_DEIPD|nr:acyl-CoA dehydrogenase family protein [Deinococcus peraridilitoris]AFZ68671.1 acyl-CoA dehydrogenase [Deinococcus peraridilitoris DSM 19664]
MLDYLKVSDLLTPDERLMRESVRSFIDAELMPHIEEWFDSGDVPTRDIMLKLGEMGLLGPNLPEEYGCAGVSGTAYGAMMYELERCDSGLRSTASVQGSLVMYPIYAYGSEEQRRTYLPELASGRMIGCFGLTESDGGSDPGAMRTRARRDGDHYVLNGSKMWITNSPVADIALVWAKDDAGDIRGFIVPTDTPGFSAPKIKRKMSLRASVTGEIVLEDCRVPASSMLPNVKGLKGPLGCLTQARYGIAWGALGALEAVYNATLTYTSDRTTFGKPIASRQLVQDKLVWMLSEHSKGLLLAWRLGTLKDSGQLNYAQVSLAKRNNVRVALQGARLARELHGGNGITTEYPVIRHMLNLETVDTYEGTHDIHTLIVGRDITGQNALG